MAKQEAHLTRWACAYLNVTSAVSGGALIDVGVPTYRGTSHAARLFQRNGNLEHTLLAWRVELHRPAVE